MLGLGLCAGWSELWRSDAMVFLNGKRLVARGGVCDVSPDENVSDHRAHQAPTGNGTRHRPPQGLDQILPNPG